MQVILRSEEIFQDKDTNTKTHEQIIEWIEQRLSVRKPNMIKFLVRSDSSSLRV